MTDSTEGALLWEPSAGVRNDANLTHYMRWLAHTRGLRFDDYDALWRWSVTAIEPFWDSLWSYFDLVYSGSWATPLVTRVMPGAKWFEGARLNYAENIFAKMNKDRPVLSYKGEDQPLIQIGWRQIYEDTARLAQALRGFGVQPGDRVVAYMPNIPETIVAFLATASLGAVWSSCSPEFGRRSVLDRFAQITPKILVAVDGYRYNGKDFDRRPLLRELQGELPSLQQTIVVPYLDRQASAKESALLWRDVLEQVASPAEIPFLRVPFDHPLWVLYSSGTTGLPKAIVQGHGGILLEHAKNLTFHNDLKRHDRFFWYTSTGWMMWNYMVGSLLTGASIILYNGSPGYPDLHALFELAEQSGMTYFGTSAAFIGACMKAGVRANARHDLSRIRGVGSTGSPLTAEGFGWVYDSINQELALESLSGGTDLCTAFVGGVRLKPVFAGEIQGAALGASVMAYDDAGNQVTGEVGELVITEPMPSMPLNFWGDQDMARYRESYFDMYPGVWRHGDWIRFNRRGGCVIYGRSDSTINRQGIRMGTSEIYRVAMSFGEIADCLVIDLESLGRDSYMPLFLVLNEGARLDDALVGRIKERLRNEVSPRHVPDAVLEIEEVPYTLSGKKMEVPVRRILLGVDPDKAVNRGAMRNPAAIDYFIEFARKLPRAN